jgi:hypothetical protein
MLGRQREKGLGEGLNHSWPLKISMVATSGKLMQKSFERADLFSGRKTGQKP